MTINPVVIEQLRKVTKEAIRTLAVGVSARLHELADDVAMCDGSHDFRDDLCGDLIMLLADVAGEVYARERFYDAVMGEITKEQQRFNDGDY